MLYENEAFQSMECNLRFSTFFKNYFIVEGEAERPSSKVIVTRQC